jgi:hypothetical protein
MDDFHWMDYQSAGNRINGKITGTKYNYAFRGNLNYFYLADWYPGTIETVDGEIHSGYNLRYDAFNDELVALNTRVKGLFTADKYLVKSFTVIEPGSGPQTFRKMKLDEFQQKEQFFKVLYEGKVLLISRVRITEHKISAYKNRLGELDDREYRLNQLFYLVKADGSYRFFSPGRKSILNLCPEQKKEVRQLLRRHLIDDFSPEGIPGIIALLEKENYLK